MVVGQEVNDCIQALEGSLLSQLSQLSISQALINKNKNRDKKIWWKNKNCSHHPDINLSAKEGNDLQHFSLPPPQPVKDAFIII